MPKVEDGPWPAFPADLTSIALALATQAAGSVMIHEKMFENRLFFTDKLVGMGASITICDPHRAIVNGPAPAARLAGGVPRHPRRHGDADRRAVRRRGDGDRQHPPDRPRLRADRRAAARTRCPHHPAGRRSRSGASSARSTRAAADSSAMVDRIPSGTRDVLPDEMRELRAMTDRIREVFDRPATARSTRPRSSTSRPSRARNIGGARPAYRVFDEHGSVLVLRPDMTVPIARVVATRYAHAEPPLRFCYVAHAYRGVRPQRGQSREFLQAGVELIGVPGAGGHRRGAGRAVRRAGRRRAWTTTGSVSATRRCTRRCSRPSGSTPSAAS